MTRRSSAVERRPLGRPFDWRASAESVRKAVADRVPDVFSGNRPGSPEDQMIARVRCVIAIAALSMIWIDPSNDQASTTLLYVLLPSFVVYSVLTYLDATARFRSTKGLSGWSHWADVGWVTVLVTVTAAKHTVFFVGYLFAISTAAFRWGFRTGALVTLASVALSSALSYLLTPTGSLELTRAVLRPVYLLVLGYMISYWGDFHVSLARRLRLLKEVSSQSNPRFGINRTLVQVMRKVQEFYDADACVVLVPNPTGNSVWVWRYEADGEGVDPSSELPLAVVAELLSLGPSETMAYTVNDNPAAALQLNSIAETLSARCFMTVPCRQRDRAGGRVYLTSRTGYHFQPADLEFFGQVVEHVTPVLENVHLVDTLATDAAEAERLRIARDLHDTVVQPYIGIHMGLAAIRQKLQTSQNVMKDLDLLSDAIALEINDLRRYLRELKAHGAARSVLVEAVSRFGARFADATGINVIVDAEENIDVNDRLAAEAFQMIAEAVSNVRRHTESRQVRVSIGANRHVLVMQVADAGTPERPARRFTPRSIDERATSLGGRVRVEPCDGGSIVSIEIPL